VIGIGIGIVGGNFLVGNQQVADAVALFEASLESALKESQQKMAAAIEKQFSLQRDAILSQISATQQNQTINPYFDAAISGWIDTSITQPGDVAMIHYVNPGKKPMLQSDLADLVEKWGALNQTVSHSIAELFVKDVDGKFVPAFPQQQ